MVSTNKVCLYAQTHWDREWYWEFEKYRAQLVSVARMLIRELEEGNMPVFHLDGQSCALEDIIQMQPDLEDKLKPLIQDKRLRVGPWYVLADQMLVSGESLIRNLDRGIRVASRYGEPLMVGYCPDTFGHTQDMPRILKGFGIDNAVVWRGVPILEDGPVFFWKSPDDSEVMAYLLPDGYYQTAFQEVQYEGEENVKEVLLPYLLSWLGLKEDASRVEGGRARSYSEYTNSSLVPVGGDHLYPPRDLARLLEFVRSRLKELKLEETVGIEVVDLGDYLNKLKAAIPEALELVRLVDGELRSNEFSSQYCRAFMLPGVLSARLYLKRNNRKSEHRLYHRTEPLFALLWAQGLIRYPEPELDHGLRLLLLNHPHDSICGCSVDDVHSQMVTRHHSLNHLLDLLERQVQEEALCPSVHEWSPEPPSGKKQESKRSPKGLGRWHMDLNDPEALVDGHMIVNLTTSAVTAPISFKFAISAESLGLKCPGHSKVVAVDARLENLIESHLVAMIEPTIPRQIDEVTLETEVFGAVGGVPVFKDVCMVSGYLLAKDVPGLGGSICLSKATKEVADSVGVNATTGSGQAPGRPSSPANGLGKLDQAMMNNFAFGSEADVCIANEYFEVRPGDDGTLKVELKGGSKKEVYCLDPVFQDLADAGDSYNFDPVYKDKPIRATFESAVPLQSGPLVASFEMFHRLEIPEGIVESSTRGFLESESDVEDITHFERSKVNVSQIIKTRVSVRAHDPIVYFDCEWNNQAKDHRLEVLLSAGSQVVDTWSENHFSLVKRTITEAQVTLPVPRAKESPLDRFPCQRFFIANGQVFLNSGLPEYSVSGDSVSITLLRAFSMLSRKRLLTRGGGAGPYMPTEDGNCLGINRASFGWSPLALEPAKAVGASKGDLSDDHRKRAYELAELYEGPLWLTPVSNSFSENLFAIADRYGSYTPEKKGDWPTDVQKGKTAWLTVSEEFVRLSSLYKIPNEKALLLRLLNVTMTNRLAKLFVNLPVKALYRADMSGLAQNELEKDKGAYKISFGKNELITLKIELDQDKI